MHNFIRQPLVHFFALGAVLFVLFGLVDNGTGEAPDEIVVGVNRIAALASGFERTWQRPPTPSELEALIESYVREEVLYREALARGLDQGDPVVRKRMAQKIEFLFEGDVRLPDDAELLAWLEAREETYRTPPRYAFEQVFFNPEKHGDRLQDTVRVALAAIESGEPPPAGDSTLLPDEVELSSTLTIERLFGPDFVAALEARPVGEWVGPLQSSYGLHLVRILRHEPGYLPAFDEIRDALERDWLQAESDRAREAFYRSLRERYDVTIDPTFQVADAAAD